MNSKSLKFLGLVFVAIYALVAVNVVLAQEAPKAPAAEPAKAPAVAEPAKAAPATPTFDATISKRGTISVVKDASGKVSAIKLITAVYEIPLDENSKALENMDGKLVVLRGMASREGEKRIFTVKSIEETKAEEMKMPEAKATEAKPVEKPAEKPAEAPATK